jgi:hypothetical protein
MEERKARMASEERARLTEFTGCAARRCSQSGANRRLSLGKRDGAQSREIIA